ncbi:protein N-terminal asparagine amidohydrolase isoform X2 [Monodelphis domestica]|uniref:protein N-terminal asparagine amidohydrolase isoform X2 n=1 Tax=Monodelphis domestica TaxID=13616 RepID=UPI0024E1A645|nr:protein N-terminal asparagine amidohydrolase isoform X2 [Monodelphis domestica]
MYPFASARLASPRRLLAEPSLTASLVFSITQERAKLLRGQPVQPVGPRGLLYVQQRELAVTSPQDGSISVLGSEDATTCHIVVLRHTGTGATCLTHCDGSDTQAEVPLILKSLKSLSGCGQDGRLEVHLVGGFNDDRQLSQKLTSQLLSEFDRQEDDIHLVTFCVTELNDREENENHFPVICGIAVNIKTAEIFRASFPERGPEEELRSARSLTGGPMINIYDAKTEQLHIGPYFWMPFPHVDFWLQQDDKQLLENLSTSPLAEPPHFVPNIRSTLMFLKKYPFPGNSLFPGNRALLYKKNEGGLWEKISSPGS